MVLGAILAGAGLLGAGFLGGKNAGGGAIEIATSKKSYQTTDSRQYSSISNYSPTVNRNYDIQYNIASGYGSSISTKKEQAISQTPSNTLSQSPTQSVVPSTSQGGGIGTGGDSSPISDVTGLLLIGGLVAGGYLLLKDKK